jgi:cysteinyl-tRNA synthetase
MRIYNTMARGKEELVPASPGEVRMYSCGVTTYDLSHVGHARMLVVFDVIARYLRFAGYRVTFVRNFTDIDDKIIRRAAQDDVSAREVSERNIAAFHEDMAALDVLPPDVEPRATEHVPEMIALVERLIAGGHAYVVDGDVYFAVRSFPGYGKLSGKNLDELQAGARVEVDERKRDPRDFALWKASRPGEPAWDSPWGPGRPGWHIECSAMSVRYLGPSFDIHGGGEDLIFPHHECEIAQTEADTGKPFARYWVHNGMVNMGREKMSKSLGNTLTIRDLVRRHDPAALRLFLLGTHYRSPLEWSEERVADSARALERLWRPVDDAERYAATATFDPAGAAANRPLPTEFAIHRQRFLDAMNDDFNTPEALAALFGLSGALRADGITPEALVRGAAELKALAGALGLRGPRRGALDEARIDQLIAERTEARRQRDFARADEIRAQVEQLGAVLEDRATGTVWRWKGR